MLKYDLATILEKQMLTTILILVILNLYYTISQRAYTALDIKFLREELAEHKKFINKELENIKSLPLYIEYRDYIIRKSYGENGEPPIKQFLPD